MGWAGQKPGDWAGGEETPQNSGPRAERKPHLDPGLPVRRALSRARDPLVGFGGDKATGPADFLTRSGKEGFWGGVQSFSCCINILTNFSKLLLAFTAQLLWVNREVVGFVTI